MTEPKGERHHFRGKPRPGRRVSLSYRVDSGGARDSTAVTKNIGIGGAFIVTEKPERPGTMLVVTIPIPSPARTVVVKGEVRWISDVDNESVHGMGVMFADFDAEDAVALEEFFSSLTETVDHDEVG